MKKILLLMVMMASVITGYAQKKTLVLYYSETGTTKTVAQELQKLFCALEKFTGKCVRRRLVLTGG